MVKGDTTLDMRGRCSAGQKVCHAAAACSLEGILNNSLRLHAFEENCIVCAILVAVMPFGAFRLDCECGCRL